MDDPKITVFALLAFALLVVVTFLINYGRLKDPKNDTVVDVEDMPRVSKLSEEGQFSVVIFRQSGGLHKDLGVVPGARSAIALVQSTFRRAGIDAVSIHSNTSEVFEVQRTFFNHRGRQEGKRVGGAKIARTG